MSGFHRSCIDGAEVLCVLPQGVQFESNHRMVRQVVLFRLYPCMNFQFDLTNDHRLTIAFSIKPPRSYPTHQTAMRMAKLLPNRWATTHNSGPLLPKNPICRRSEVLRGWLWNASSNFKGGPRNLGKCTAAWTKLSQLPLQLPLHLGWVFFIPTV